jgi:hypothetical protein
VPQEHESAALEFLVLTLLVEGAVAADQAHEVGVAQRRIRIQGEQVRRGAELRETTHETL